MSEPTAPTLLIDAVRTAIADAPAHPGVGAAMKACVRSLDEPPRWAAEPRPLTAGNLAALDALGSAIHPPSVGPLVSALRAHGPRLDWIPAYPDDDRAFVRPMQLGYRYTTLIGPSPEALFPCSSAALFVTIQGPHIEYPPHHHDAPELYRVIAGSGAWQVHDDAFVDRGPGDWIWHPVRTPHAMTTATDAMVAIAIWTADLDGRYVLSEP